MACIYSSGYSLGDNCLDNISGVKEFYIANYSGTTTWGYDVDGVVTGVTGTTTFYKIEQRREQGAVTETHQQSENGVNVWTQGVEMVFHKQTAATRDLVKVMAQTQTVIIALKNNGDYVLVGQENGCEMKNSEGGSGKAMEDFSGYRVNFEGKEKEPMRLVSSTLIGTLTIN